jgi:predicted nucleic acid-binding Zn ribbon protein
MRRLLSAPAIQFKGTGWYVTDYARKSSSSSDESRDSKEGSRSKPKESGEVKSGSKGKASSESSGKKTPASD